MSGREMAALYTAQQHGLTELFVLSFSMTKDTTLGECITHLTNLFGPPALKDFVFSRLSLTQKGFSGFTEHLN